MYSFLAGWSSCGRLYAVQTGSPTNNLINCKIQTNQRFWSAHSTDPRPPHHIFVSKNSYIPIPVRICLLISLIKKLKILNYPHLILPLTSSLPNPNNLSILLPPPEQDYRHGRTVFRLTHHHSYSLDPINTTAFAMHQQPPPLLPLHLSPLLTLTP